MARHWAVGPQLTSDNQRDIIEQMREWGASQAQIEQYTASEEPDDCEVIEENEAAVAWFLSVDDLWQWAFTDRSVTMLGLDVKAVHADAQMRGLETQPEDYNKLRIIARAAANHYNDKARD